MFMGDSLRGMLLSAYAFGTLGTIAIYAAIAAAVGALAMTPPASGAGRAGGPCRRSSPGCCYELTNAHG
jgi:hypothetical protein